MKGFGKRMLAMLLSFMMVASVITPTAFADETVPETAPVETVEETKQAEVPETAASSTESSKETQAPETEQTSPQQTEAETPAKETEETGKEETQPTEPSKDQETEEPSKDQETEEPSKEDSGKKGAPSRAGETETIMVTFDPTTDPAEPLQPQTIQVNAGEAIGNQLPDVPEVAGYTTKWVNSETGTEITADTIVEEAFTAVVANR